MFSFSSVYAQYINDIMIVIDNLRLRESDNVNSNIITTMNKGSFVKILRIGKEDVINGNKSYWYLVQVLPDAKNITDEYITDGTAGWCFGSYLKPQTDFFIENLDAFLNCPFESFNNLQNDEKVLVSLFGKLQNKEVENVYWGIWDTTIAVSTYIFDGIIVKFNEKYLDSIIITNPEIKLNINIALGMTRDEICSILGNSESHVIQNGSITREIVTYELNTKDAPNGSHTAHLYYQNEELIKIVWFHFIP